MNFLQSEHEREQCEGVLGGFSSWRSDSWKSWRRNDLWPCSNVQGLNLTHTHTVQRVYFCRSDVFTLYDLTEAVILTVLYFWGPFSLKLNLVPAFTLNSPLNQVLTLKQHFEEVRTRRNVLTLHKDPNFPKTASLFKMSPVSQKVPTPPKCPQCSKPSWPFKNIPILQKCPHFVLKALFKTSKLSQSVFKNVHTSQKCLHFWKMSSLSESKSQIRPHTPGHFYCWCGPVRWAQVGGFNPPGFTTLTRFYDDNQPVITSDSCDWE